MANSIEEINSLEKENKGLAKDLETRTEDYAGAILQRDTFYRNMGILKHYVKHHVDSWGDVQYTCECGLTAALSSTVDNDKDVLKQKLLWEHNRVRVHNKAIEQAAWLAWDLRKEGRYVLVLTEKEILILRKALHDKKLTDAKLVLRDQLDGALDDEDTTGPIVDAILKLQVAWYADDVEALYTRQQELAQKQYYPDFEKLTPEKEVEYKEIQQKISELPTGRDIQDQEAQDSIRMAAELLKWHKYDIQVVCPCAEEITSGEFCPTCVRSFSLGQRHSPDCTTPGCGGSGIITLEETE